MRLKKETIKMSIDKKLATENGPAIEIGKKARKHIRIPDYTVGEEIMNAVSHGIGTPLAIAALVLMLVKAKDPLAVGCAIAFGVSMIILYTISCVYHALSPKLYSKGVMRVIDHCNVHLLVCATYVPASLMGVGGAKGWIMFSIVAFFSLLGIIATTIDVDKYSKLSVACHLLSGWSILIGIKELWHVMGTTGIILIAAGGVCYSIGAVLYGLGKKKRYMHSIFHVFCLAATVLQFLGLYLYLF